MKYQYENVHYACTACITIDSVMKMKKELYTSLFRRMQIQNKEKMSKFIKAELESESESELQSDTESKPKSELEPDPEYW